MAPVVGEDKIREGIVKRVRWFFFVLCLGIEPLSGQSVEGPLALEGSPGLFTYVHKDFLVDTGPTVEGEFFVQTAVRFPSPIETPYPENNTVHCVLIEPKGAVKASIISLPIWGNKDTLLEEIVGKALASKGYRVLIVSMAYQHKRSPKGVRSGHLTVSEDLQQTGWSIHQSVVDVRRAAYWLTHEKNVPPEELGVMGISLGSFVATLSYCVERKFGAAAIILGGGNPGGILLRDSQETSRIAGILRSKGWTEEKLNEVFKSFAPETYATPELGQHVLMINAAYDTIIPYESSVVLHKAFGQPKMLWIPASHYSGLLFLSDLVTAMDAHFSRWLVAPRGEEK